MALKHDRGRGDIRPKQTERMILLSETELIMSRIWTLAGFSRGCCCTRYRRRTRPSAD